jgi:hypothetical protein
MKKEYIGKDYVVQVCDLPEHLIPHEGSWVVYGDGHVMAKHDANNALNEALSCHNWARIVTMETFRRKYHD